MLHQQARIQVAIINLESPVQTVLVAVISGCDRSYHLPGSDPGADGWRVRYRLIGCPGYSVADHHYGSSAHLPSPGHDSRSRCSDDSASHSEQIQPAVAG